MVIIKLLIGDRPVITVLQMLTLGQYTDRRTVHNRLKPHLRKILYCPADHPFESKHVADLNDSLLRQVLPRLDESLTISFRVDVCHLLDHIFRKPVKMTRRPKLILTDILAEPVQISKILKITVHNDIRGKRFLWIDLFTDPVRRKYIAVIAGIPVDMIPDLFELLVLRRLLLEQKLPCLFPFSCHFRAFHPCQIVDRRHLQLRNRSLCI